MGMLKPLLEQCRPNAKTPLQDLQRTMDAILRSYGNGAGTQSEEARTRSRSP
jgi:ElaB/YqjD/DUF883 family membrane-anchored ribosome-binding protein